MSGSTRIKNILFVLAFVVLIVGAVFGYKAITGGFSKSSDEDDTAVTTGVTSQSGMLRTTAYEIADDFTVLNMDGEEVKLTDMVGKPIVLNFWTSWCGPCQSEMYDFESVYQEYGDDVVFMMVNITDGTSETVESATEYVEKHEFTFPVYFDTKRDAQKAYSIYSFPHTFFIDKDGYLVADILGMTDSETIKEGIARLEQQ